jgi:hypothetical protein
VTFTVGTFAAPTIETQERNTTMAKKSNRETLKPKQVKPKAEAATTTLLGAAGKGVGMTGGKKSGRG